MTFPEISPKISSLVNTIIYESILQMISCQIRFHLLPVIMITMTFILISTASNVIIIEITTEIYFITVILLS